MAGLLGKPNKRKCYPVPLDDRKIHVRSMTFDEIERMDALDKKLQTPFMLGMCLVAEDGTPEVEKLEGEDDAAFCLRVKQLLKDATVDTETAGKIGEAIGKIGSTDVETVAKNS